MYPPGLAARRRSATSISQMDQSKIDAAAVVLREARGLSDGPRARGARGIGRPGVPRRRAAVPRRPDRARSTASRCDRDADASRLIDAVPATSRSTSGSRRTARRRTSRLTRRTVPGADEPLVGVLLVDVFPFEITIESGEVGGPSAGLMWALGLYDLLTPATSRRADDRRHRRDRSRRQHRSDRRDRATRSSAAQRRGRGHPVGPADNIAGARGRRHRRPAADPGLDLRRGRRTPPASSEAGRPELGCSAMASTTVRIPLPTAPLAGVRDRRRRGRCSCSSPSSRASTWTCSGTGRSSLSQVFWTRIWAQAGLASAFFVTFFALLLREPLRDPPAGADDRGADARAGDRRAVPGERRAVPPVGDPARRGAPVDLRRPRRRRALAGVPALAVLRRDRVREPRRGVRPRPRLLRLHAAVAEVPAGLAVRRARRRHRDLGDRALPAGAGSGRRRSAFATRWTRRCGRTSPCSWG